MARDNIPRVRIDRLWKVLLVPALIIQWLIYMNPARGIQGVAQTTRIARSPFFTYAISVCLWLYVLLAVVSRAMAE